MADQQGPTSQPQGQPQPRQAQQPLAPIYDYRDDEISLYELWNILVRRRWLIGAVFVLALVGATFFAVTRTPTYMMDAVVEIGEMPSLDGGSLQSIESPASFVSRLNEVIIPAVISAAESQNPETGIPSPEAEVLNGDAKLVRLFVEIPHAEETRVSELMAVIVDRSTALHDQRMEQRREFLQQRLVDLQAEIDRVAEARSGLFSEISNVNRANAQDIEESGDVSQQLAATLGGIVNVLVARETDSDITSLKATIDRLQAVAGSTEPTQLARRAALADSPEGQPASTIVALGAVLGLMLGVFAAFGREFIANAANAAGGDGVDNIA